MREFEETLLAFNRSCRAAKVEHAFVGAIAVIAWGQPRLTADIDVLVHLQPAQVVAFASAIAAEGLHVETDDLRASLRDASHVTVFEDDGPYHVDVKLARSNEEIAEVRDARGVAFAGEEIPVVRPEETIAFKLKFGSAVDVQDAFSIVVRQRSRLDMDRLRKLSARLGVQGKLNRLLQDAGKAQA